jgi:hypothetical protein
MHLYACPRIQISLEDLGPSTNAARSRCSLLYLSRCLHHLVWDFRERVIRILPSRRMVITAFKPIVILLVYSPENHDQFAAEPGSLFVIV